MAGRNFRRVVGTICLSVVGLILQAQAQEIFPGPNINMVSGTTWPDGDPFLNKQNEGSLSVSTRNELHLAGGSNDYRAMDLPGLREGKTTGDSWPSLYWSTNGGGSWKSTLLPGYPQDTSPLGAISPLKTALGGAGFEAGADPWVRFGASGLLSYSGIAFIRDTEQSAGFVATYMDLNNTEIGNPFGYIGTVLFDLDETGTSFIDLPRHAVDKPRAGSQLATLNVHAADGEIISQTIECGNIYVAYARIRGDGTAAVNSDIMFTRSPDCGQTFSEPIVLSGPDTINQGGYVAVEPFSGDVQVAWRQFENATLNCSYGEDYWRDNPNAWPVSEITIAGETYAAGDSAALFPRNDSGGTPWQLLRQLLGAWLNVLSGAERSDEVVQAMADAEDWLLMFPPGSDPKQDDKKEGDDLRKLLRDYNQGKLGPVMCASLEGGGLSGLNPDAIMVVRSTDFGQTFSAPVAATGDDYHPFEQGTTEFSFRTTSYASMVFDNEQRSYIAVQTRGLASADSDPVGGNSRIAITTSTDGVTWTPLQAIDDVPLVPNHQVQPSLAFHRDELFALYYDFRNDRLPRVDRFIVDLPFNDLITFRHTTDVRIAVAAPSDTPEFTNYSLLRESKQASRYPTLVVHSPSSGELIEQQLKFNFPSLPISKGGFGAFFGDFTDIGIQQFFYDDSTNTWEYDIDDTRGAPVVHPIWTDNRDVVPPPLGFGWDDYVPPTYNFDVDGNPDPAPASFFDPSVPRAVCTPGDDSADLTQMRNQNVYTALVTKGVAAGIPGNNRTLSLDLQRVFVAFVQNTTTQDKTFRLNIPFQPIGGKASFDQFAELPVTMVDVVVKANSSISKSIFVTALDPRATIEVEVFDVTSGVPTIAARMLINSDPTAPVPDEANISFEEIYTPTIFNPSVFDDSLFDIAQLGSGEIGIASPTIFNLAPGEDPDLAALMLMAIENPTIFNSTIFNLAEYVIANPTIFNSTVLTPTIFNPTIFNFAQYVLENPTIFNSTLLSSAILSSDPTSDAVLNPTIFNPTIFNQAVEGEAVEASAVVVNSGNAAAAYSVNIDLGDVPEGFLFQLIVYRTYTVPSAEGCALTETVIQETLVNEIDPNVTGDLRDPNSTSFYVDPGENVVVMLRILPDPTAPVPGDPTTIDTLEELEIAVSIVPQAVDTNGLNNGETEPTPTIVFGSFPSGLLSDPPPGWTPNADATNANFLWATDFGRTDSSSVRIQATERNVPLANPSWRSDPVTITDPTATYEASVYTFTPDGGVGHFPALQMFAADGSFLGTAGAVGPSGFMDPVGVWLQKSFTISSATVPTFASVSSVRVLIIQDIEDTLGTVTTVFFDDPVLQRISGGTGPNLLPNPSFAYVTDQEQPAIDAAVGGLTIGGASSQQIGQVVTAGISGSLRELYLPVACAVGDLIIEIQDVVAGQPNGVVLTSEIVPGAELPTFFPQPPRLRSLSLSASVHFDAGDTYAIVLRSLGDCTIFQGPLGDSYSGGDGSFNNLPFPGWIFFSVFAGSHNDLPFRTVVLPD